MSHVAQVDVKIQSLDDLRAACKRIGLEFVEGQQTYRWYGRSVGDYPLPDGFTADDLGKCEHAIRLPHGHASLRSDDRGAYTYEIGVVRNKDGRPGWSLLWDFFSGGFGLQEVVGENCNALKQAYAICAGKRAAQMKGFAVQEVKQANGSVKLICKK